MPSRPSMPAFKRALAIISSTIGPSLVGSSTGLLVGPRCQPSAIANTSPLASNTRPVIPADSLEANHVTIGAIHFGDRCSRSASVSGAGHKFSVIRVNATGATALTVTPYRVNSSDAMFVNAAMPAFAAP